MVFKQCQLIRFKVVYSFVKSEFMFTLQFESQIPPYYTAHYIAASLLKLHNTPTVFNFSLRSIIFFHAPLPQENFFPGTDFYFNFSFFVQNQNLISLKWYSREFIVFNDPAKQGGIDRALWAVKFIYSEKATKFCEIFTLFWSYVVPVKSKVKISQNFVAFSDYMNFTRRGAVAWFFLFSLL